MNTKSQINGAERRLDIKVVISALKNASAYFRMLEPSVSQRYMLALLFLKYISDQVEGGSPIPMPPHSKFSVLFQKREAQHIGPLVNIAIQEFATANKGLLDGVFGGMDFDGPTGFSVENWRHSIRKSLELIHALDLKAPWPDLMNEVYGHLVARTEKYTGAYFTPLEVASLIPELLELKPGETICDPACGTGNLLLSSGRYLQAKGAGDVRLFGQEFSEDHWMVAKMNLFLNGWSGRLEWEDTLWYPQLLNGKGQLLKFDVIVANPPFSSKGWGAEKAKMDPHNRFDRGVPQANRIDMAFLSHIVETMNSKTGRVAVILPLGSLTRKGSDQKIRQALIEENLVDAVIGLPSKIFKNILCVAIVILKKQRPDKSILFIDGSEEYKPGKRMILTEEGASRIVSAYQWRTNEGGFARLVPCSEIQKAALNPNFY